MGTLQPDTHSGRLAAGDAVLAAAEAVDTRSVAKKLADFGKHHGALRKATEALVAAEAKVAAAQHAVAEADNDQDAAVRALAVAVVGIGQSRTQPFKGLSEYTPSALEVQGYEAEAKEIGRVVAKLRKRKDLTAPVTAACKEAERAAAAVLAALSKLPALRSAESAARARRDALTQPWETAFSALKRAARAADDDGAPALFATLFQTTAGAATRKKAAKKRPSPTPPA